MSFGGEVPDNTTGPFLILPVTDLHPQKVAVIVVAGEVFSWRRLGTP